MVSSFYNVISHLFVTTYIPRVTLVFLAPNDGISLFQKCASVGDSDSSIWYDRHCFGRTYFWIFNTRRILFSWIFLLSFLLYTSIRTNFLLLLRRLLIPLCYWRFYWTNSVKWNEVRIIFSWIFLKILKLWDSLQLHELHVIHRDKYIK